jgi:hypothetical protein
MRTPAVWRVAILVATLICVVMLFVPLVREMLARLAESNAPLP